MIAYYCVEDSLSRAVALRLLSPYPDIYLTELAPQQGGNAMMRSRFGSYCQLAQHHPTIILTDLDATPCAPELRAGWLASAQVREPLPDGMAFCIAVREVESWLLADAERFANFLGVRPQAIDPQPERNLDPKQHVLELARRSRRREVREGLPPPAGSDGKVGLEYNPLMEDFARHAWRPDVAAANSASLRRAMDRIAASQV